MSDSVAIVSGPSSVAIVSTNTSDAAVVGAPPVVAVHSVESGVVALVAAGQGLPAPEAMVWSSNNW